MVKVKLKGILGEKFGENWNLKVKNPIEAMKAIAANRKNFKDFVINNKNLFVKFVINNEECKSLVKQKREIKEIEIIPVFVGGINKSTFGIIQIVVGALLIAAGIALAGTVVGAFLAPAFVLGGLALLASGVITLLTPNPEFNRQSVNRRSSLFDGSAQTTIQGSPVPVIYGELIVESLPITSEINSQDE